MQEVMNVMLTKQQPKIDRTLHITLIAFLITILFTTTSAIAESSIKTENTVKTESAVKLSRNGICHSIESPAYHQLKNYQKYLNIAACIAAGGRPPKEGFAEKKPPKESQNPTIPNYERNAFEHWVDTDKDCLNTRHELLAKLSTGPVHYSKSRCTVMHGRWLDPYTGSILTESKQVDIDHLVPLKWAWDHGAHLWEPKKRAQFANDEVNLFAVTNTVNRDKGSAGILEWLPPDSIFHCQYIIRFIRVVKTYQLSLNEEEQKKVQQLKEQKCSK